MSGVSRNDLLLEGRLLKYYNPAESYLSVKREEYI